MNSTPIISIVVPVFNAEGTIIRTLDSLTDNNYDIEIICVNDGSKDQSEAKINQKSDEDHRIRQIVKENGGASSARNTGLKSARGRYIMFCDADDEYDSNLLKHVIEDIKEYEPDYIVFDRKTVYENGTGFDWLKYKNRTYWNDFSWTEYFNYTLTNRNHSHVVFNKVYKNQIIREHQINFHIELVLCEDLYFNFAYLQYATNMVEDGRAKYLQHKVSNSLTAGKRKDYFFQDTKVLDVISNEYGDVIQQFDCFFNLHILHSAIHVIERAMLGRDAESLRDKRVIIHNILNDKKFKRAYVKVAENVNSYEKKKLKLLHYRLTFVYYIRFFVLPKIKGNIETWIEGKKHFIIP